MSLIARIVVGGIRGYQRWLSPFFGYACRFAPTCSEYARIAVTEHGVLVGAALAFGRLLRCHPFHPGGLDMPPPARRRWL